MEAGVGVWLRSWGRVWGCELDHGAGCGGSTLDSGSGFGV